MASSEDNLKWFHRLANNYSDRSKQESAHSLDEPNLLSLAMQQQPTQDVNIQEQVTEVQSEQQADMAAFSSPPEHSLQLVNLEQNFAAAEDMLGGTPGYSEEYPEFQTKSVCRMQTYFIFLSRSSLYQI